MTRLYFILVGLFAAQRLGELIYSTSNQKKLKKEGYLLVEGREKFIVVVGTHLLWFIALISEPLYRPGEPPLYVSVAALVVLFAAELLRFWTLRVLRVHWNVSVMTPGENIVDKRTYPLFVIAGPYRFIRHPNYLALILELFFLPLVGGAYFTAVVFAAVNGFVLRHRISAEESYLFKLPGYSEAMAGKGRVLPRKAK